ncbi:XRE family transcriptional regulator [soil metagenome]
MPGQFCQHPSVSTSLSAPRSEEDPVTALDAAIDLQAERIGGRIRALRRARGFTLVQLAELSELSHPFLSQLERGRARPSMVSLERIARALGSSQLELIAAAEDLAQPSPSLLVRADEGTRGHYGEGEARMLVQGARRFHPMEFTGSNLEPGAFFVHDEDEFIHVVAGSVRVELGEESSVLREGDSLYYVGGTPHRWTALSPDGYRLFVVKEKPDRL